MFWLLTLKSSSLMVLFSEMTWLISLISLISMSLLNKSPQFLIIFSISLTLWIMMFLTSQLKTLWFSLMLFLVMIGGLLIMFIYLISLYPNEKTQSKWKNSFLLLILLPLISSSNPAGHLLFNKNNDSLDLMIIFNHPSITIFMISYLIITLFAVVKLSSLNKGPIQMNEK